MVEATEQLTFGESSDPSGPIQWHNLDIVVPTAKKESPAPLISQSAEGSLLEMPRQLPTGLGAGFSSGQKQMKVRQECRQLRLQMMSRR